MGGTSVGIHTENKYAGYLFAYFEGTGEGKLQEHLRFAISKDAKDWYALNNNRPIVSSDTISTSAAFATPISCGAPTVTITSWQPT